MASIFAPMNQTTTLSSDEGEGLYDPRMISSLSNSQESTLVLLFWFSALLSISGSSWILYDLRGKNRNHHKASFRRILGSMAFWDISFSTQMILSPLLVPADTSQQVWAIGNDASCNFLGFLTSIMFASVYYNGTLSLYYVMTITGRYSDAEFGKKIEPYCHFVNVCYPLATAIVGLAKGFYSEHEVGPGCWVDDYPRNCGPDIELGQTGEKCQSQIIAWLFSGLPTLLMLIMIIINNIVIIQHVNRKLTSENKHLVRQVANQAFLYVAAFIASIGIGLVLRIAEGQDLWYPEDDDKLFPFYVVVAICLPLQGFWNALIYMRPRLMKKTGQLQESSFYANKSGNKSGKSVPSSLAVDVDGAIKDTEIDHGDNSPMGQTASTLPPSPIEDVDERLVDSDRRPPSQRTDTPPKKPSRFASLFSNSSRSSGASTGFDTEYPVNAQMEKVSWLNMNFFSTRHSNEDDSPSTMIESVDETGTSSSIVNAKGLDKSSWGVASHSTIVLDHDDHEGTSSKPNERKKSFMARVMPGKRVKRSPSLRKMKAAGLDSIVENSATDMSTNNERDLSSSSMEDIILTPEEVKIFAALRDPEFDESKLSPKEHEEYMRMKEAKEKRKERLAKARARARMIHQRRLSQGSSSFVDSNDGESEESTVEQSAAEDSQPLTNVSLRKHNDEGNIISPINSPKKLTGKTLHRSSLKISSEISTSLVSETEHEEREHAMEKVNRDADSDTTPQAPQKYESSHEVE